MSPRSATDVDRHIGERLREIRRAKGMSQVDLAVATGITFQQVQKYERVVNRIAASRLLQVAGVLGVPVTEFFGEADHAEA